MDRVASYIRFEELPLNFPTHRHSAKFWEQLGRTVATFGFLEEILAKAIFAFTATKKYDSEEAALAAYEKWIPQLERALSDTLYSLSESYDKARRENPESADEQGRKNIVGLVKDISKIRNALCHGSWGQPDAKGKSVPLFVAKNGDIFETAIDVSFLRQVQVHTTEVACAIINSVTTLGWNFPGSTGPGEVIMKPHNLMKMQVVVPRSKLIEKGESGGTKRLQINIEDLRLPDEKFKPLLFEVRQLLRCKDNLTQLNVDLIQFEHKYYEYRHKPEWDSPTVSYGLEARAILSHCLMLYRSCFVVDKLRRKPLPQEFNHFEHTPIHIALRELADKLIAHLDDDHEVRTDNICWNFDLSPDGTLTPRDLALMFERTLSISRHALEQWREQIWAMLPLIEDRITTITNSVRDRLRIEE